jgi:tetrahydromethanopterin S-methyltransferase subunit G
MEPWGQETDEEGHVFTVVPSQLCINCHANNLHAPALTDEKLAAGGHQLASFAPQQMEVLSQRIAETEKKNESLQNWVLIMLGVGLGVGIVIGIVVMLLIGYLQNHKEAAA